MSKLMFAKTHEWVLIEGNKGKIGLSDHAQRELGDLVFVNLPTVGAKLECGQPLCDVESVKAVSDVMSPVAGTVTAVNDTLEATPESINNDPMGSWICEAEITGQEDGLMDETAYKEFLK